MNLPAESQEPVEIDSWEKLKQDVRSEYEQTQVELKEVIMLIEQSPRLEGRNMVMIMAPKS